MVTLLTVFVSHYLLQLSQNNGSFRLATLFIFSWHTQKFLLGSLVLLCLNLWIVSLIGSVYVGNGIYFLLLSGIGMANYQKMALRMEPIYPDDLKMAFEWTMMKDIIGGPLFILVLLLACLLIGALLWTIKQSLKLPKRWQYIRLGVLLLTSLFLCYTSQFNQPGNVLRKEYDKTAKWIPYSQKMNYYNTGFMGGFMYNLRVDAMEKPAGYSKDKMEAIVTEYQNKAEVLNKADQAKEAPNVVYIMSESFSDPLRMTGFDLTPDPLTIYRDIANASVMSGQMLSQNYGGGTANIEFEALTGLSMGLFSQQMTTPYTMLVSKEKHFPSLVSNLKHQGYDTTAIHPYNTSMYKRKDVYQAFGFDQFLDEKTMTHRDKLTPNGYISDESAFNEVLDQLTDQENPQFIHLVTMQTHMPYGNKYDTKKYQVKGEGNDDHLANYAQDIAYTSEALSEFIDQLNQVTDRETVVVFWGDHLPSVYSEKTLEANSKVNSHLTEYFLYDTRTTMPTQSKTLSPFYFPMLVSDTPGIEKNGFDILLSEMYDFLPAFEKEYYYYHKQWQNQVSLTPSEQEIYDRYQMIQYDVTEGEHYSLALFQ